MIKPWELKSSDLRVEDTLCTFIIFCEDEVSEQLYFSFFETSKIKVNVIQNQKSMMSNVISAITYCKENGVLIQNQDQFTLSNSDIQVWCVYDRDYENDPSNNSKGDTEFDESISTAESKGIKVAWSNDSFELWVLLHFENVDHHDINHHKRDYYYNRLTEIFMNIENPNEDLKKALIHASFGYKKDLKQKNNFRDIVRPIIISNTQNAIKRAKVLHELQKTKPLHHEKKPCTQIFTLVEELLNKGGKVLN